MANFQRDRKDQGGMFDGDKQELYDKVVKINRVAKVVKGGRRFSFSALVVVGDKNGKVGFGKGKANEVPEAIRKGLEKAKKSMTKVPIVDATIPHEIIGRFGAARVMLKPASPGTGIIAGGAVRALMETAGVHDVLTKCIGTRNPHNVVKAAWDGLMRLRTKEQIVSERGKKTEEIIRD